MTADRLQALVSDFLHTSPANLVPAEKALAPDCAGLRIYDTPLLGFADARDPLFAQLRDTPEVNLPDLLLPTEWLPAGRTVVSIFLPFTQEVRASNRADMSWPSSAWMNARIEGQQCIVALCRHLQQQLEAAGFASLTPLLDSRFASWEAPHFRSNWSERHAGYVCGLGTFSLSKGLITRRGMAGRFGSLITALELPPTPRSYRSSHEHCTLCGQCVAHCPVGAISLESGKDHAKCAAFLAKTKEPSPPYYGCGKCQVGLPCEERNPAAVE